MNQVYDFMKLYSHFIKVSKTGKRRKKNGARITKGTIKGYENTQKLLLEFCSKKNFSLRVIPTNRLNKREFAREKKYWNRFYREFTDFLYNDKGVYDNYVGFCIKPIRIFFRYLNSEQNISIGEIYKTFYVASERNRIITLQPNQLSFLINDETFHQQLTKRQQEVKDIFVFGSTVALRFSDLMRLKPVNIVQLNNISYLQVISKKTKTNSQVKLPDFALSIALKYQSRKRYLFPQYHLATFNNLLKQIGEKAGWTEIVTKERMVKGIPQHQFKDQKKRNHYRFCDLMSSHLMRRTAITSMLMFGIDETVVRRISGHAAGSKEFFRYVEYAQSFTDSQTDTYFSRLNRITE